MEVYRKKTLRLAKLKCSNLFKCLRLAKLTCSKLFMFYSKLQYEINAINIYNTSDLIAPFYDIKYVFAKDTLSATSPT